MQKTEWRVGTEGETHGKKIHHYSVASGEPEQCLVTGKLEGRKARHCGKNKIFQGIL
jgi:hypothetical protein